MSTTLARNKEGVPIWDGEAGTFNDFEEASLMWEQSVAYQKRYLCGPRIQAELTEAARRLVAGKSPTWLSHSGGVRELMRHLRSCLGKPQIAELSEFLILNRYFKNSRRKPSESINEYVTRKCEIYLRAQQALRRVAPHQKKASMAGSTTSSTPGPPRCTWRSSQWPSSNVTENAENEEPGEVQSAAPTVEAETEEEAPRSPARGRIGHGVHGMAMAAGSPGVGAATAGEIHLGPGLHGNGTRTTRDPWMKRKRCQSCSLTMCKGGTSGLSTNEKNIIQTALQGDFSLQKVAQELRNQWSGGDLARRDHGLRQGSYIGEYHEEVEDDDGSEVLTKTTSRTCWTRKAQPSGLERKRRHRQPWPYFMERRRLCEKQGRNSIL